MNRHIATKPASNPASNQALSIATTTHADNAGEAGESAEINGIHLPLSVEARDALHREALAFRREAIREAGKALSSALLAAFSVLLRGLSFRTSSAGMRPRTS